MPTTDAFDAAVFEHNDTRFIEDPYPFYAIMRERFPRYSAERLFGGALLFFRYDDIAKLLKDPRLSTSRARLPVAGLGSAQAAEFEPMFSSFDDWIAFNEFDQHRRMRRHAERTSAPLRIRELTPRVTRIVEELMADAGDAIDVMSDLAFQLPGRVLAEVFGVPRHDVPQLITWSDDIAHLYGSTNLAAAEIRRIACSAGKLLGYLDRLADNAGPDSLLTHMMSREVGGYRPTRAQAVAHCVMLLFAALEPTAYLVGNTVAALQEHPDQLEILRSRPALTANTVEEVLRYDTPVQFVGRIARQDFTYEDCRIRRGQAVLCYVASAHRDPACYDAPELLDVQRQRIRHLAFGRGAHLCLGASMVRVVATEAVRAIIREFPELSADRDGAVVWNTNLGFRGRRRLRIRR